MTDKIIRIRLDASQANRDIGQLDQSMVKAGRSADGLATSVTRIATAVASALSVQKIAAYADQWTDLESRFRNAVGAGEDAADVLARINDIANRSFSSLQNTSEAFLLNARTLSELGFQTQKQLDLTESLSLALVVSGAKQQRAESVTNAFSKAIAAGVLRGENFNTVIQQGGEVAAALADGLGVTTIELKRLADEGLLTVDKIVPALISQLDNLQKKAGDMPATIADAFLILNNRLTESVGKLSASTGAANKVSDSILFVANNLEALGAALAVTASAIGANYVVALTGAAASNIAMTKATLSAAMASKAQAQAAFFAANGVRVKDIAVRQATASQVAYNVAARAGAVALGFLAGPAGLILLAASAFLIFANNASTAREKTAQLDAEIAKSVARFKELNEQGKALTFQKLAQEQASLLQQITEANKTVADAVNSSNQAARNAGGRQTAATRQASQDVENARKSLDGLNQRLDQVVATQTALFEVGAPKFENYKDSVDEAAEAVGILANNFEALRKVSSGIDSIFSGELNLFGDDGTQTDEQRARIQKRISDLRLETELSSSEYEIRRQVFAGFLEQGEADILISSERRLQQARAQAELLLNEESITNEQRLEVTKLFEDSKTQIEQDAALARQELYRAELLTKIGLTEQFSNAAINIIAAFGSKSFQAQKNAAIATGIVNIASGVAKALNNPYPANLGFAAQVASQGAALIGTMRSTNLGSSSGSFSGGGASAAPQPTTPTSAPLVGNLEISGLSALTDELRNYDGLVPASFVARILEAIPSANRLRGEDV
jgi:tape measure domain-containing protein